MSEEKNEEKAVVTVMQPQPDLSLAEWGSRNDVVALANRIKSMLPGGEKMTNSQAMAVAQYAILTDANPFRGEVYAWTDWKGQTVLDDGYKLLVRWAKRKCDYSEWYSRMTGLPEGNIGETCHILRKDNLETLKVLAPILGNEEAMKVVTITADGVVTREEMWSKKHNRPIDPPTGWTWEQVARKRALKNALNRSHGAPSLREIAQESWMVEGTKTTAEDWERAMSDQARSNGRGTDRLAALYAREGQQNIHGPADSAERRAASESLYGDGGDLVGKKAEPPVVEGEVVKPPKSDDKEVQDALARELEAALDATTDKGTALRSMNEEQLQTIIAKVPRLAGQARLVLAEYRNRESACVSLVDEYAGLGGEPDYPEGLTFDQLSAKVGELQAQIASFNIEPQDDPAAGA